MFDNDARGLESPERQHESADDCPFCGTVIRGLVTRGPSDHFFEPCGCRAGTATAREIAGDGPEVMTDGGREMTEWECGDCGDSFETPGEPELPCLKCGADEWREVDAE